MSPHYLVNAKMSFSKRQNVLCICSCDWTKERKLVRFIFLSNDKQLVVALVRTRICLQVSSSWRCGLCAQNEQRRRANSLLGRIACTQCTDHRCGLSLTSPAMGHLLPRLPAVYFYASLCNYKSMNAISHVRCARDFAYHSY